MQQQKKGISIEENEYKNILYDDDDGELERKKMFYSIDWNYKICVRCVCIEFLT